MKNFKLATFLLGVFFLLSACNKEKSENLPSVFKIIPQPQKVEMLDGTGLKYQELSGLEMTGLSGRPVMGEILSRLPGVHPNESVLSLVIDPGFEETNNPEGYVLTIEDGSAEIRSVGEAGIFYGCQTLEQLLEDARDFNTDIPSCKITDYPAMSYRAVHFDVKHHLDHMNYYYESIDRLARYKINAVIFEFEDKLRYERQPLVGAPQAMSIDEMAALTRYAAERHIDISPLVQGLGHATFILKHEHYAPLREIPNKTWVFCPVDDGTYEVLFDMYRDAMDATPGSRYLHIGGDEIGDIGICPRCKPIADRDGVLSLNMYWLNKVSDFIIENGRIPIFWDDMPLKEAGVYESTWNVRYDSAQAIKDWKKGESELVKLVKQLPKKCVYMRWNYEMGRLPGNIKALEWYKQNGLSTMVATATTGGLLFPQDQRTGKMSDVGLSAIKSFLHLGSDEDVVGMLCTAWDDQSTHFETYWRGFIASAEYSWSSEGISLDDFDEAYLQREYAISQPDYTRIYKMLTEAATLWGSALMRNGSRTEIRNALLNLPGLAHWIPEEEKEKQQQKTDFTDLVIELPDLGKPGSWSKLYEDRLITAGKVMKEYNTTSKELDGLYERSKRNRYHWEVFIALNDLQVTAPALLLALKQCDTDDKTQLAEGKKAVREAISQFDKSWETLQRVYSETRFISYPDNYVPDRYFHFASQREDLTWMIQAEELLHSITEEWLKE